MRLIQSTDLCRDPEALWLEVRANVKQLLHAENTEVVMGNGLCVSHQVRKSLRWNVPSSLHIKYMMCKILTLDLLWFPG